MTSVGPGGSRDDTSYHYVLSMKTGTYKGASTFSGKALLRFNPNDDQNDPSEIFSLGGRFTPGKTRTVDITVGLPIDAIKEVEVWMERPPNNPDITWFVEHMTLKEESQGVDLFFPFHRWVTLVHQAIHVNNAMLPQNDSNQQRRSQEIHLAKRNYGFESNVADCIPCLSELKASPEEFSIQYTLGVFVVPTVLGTIKEKLLLLFSPRWRRLNDTWTIYDRALMDFDTPEIVSKYKEIIPGEDWSGLDKVFGAQRLIGTNPAVIQRVISMDRLEECMDLSDEDSFKRQMKMSISEAIESKRLFMVDYTTILHRIQTRNTMITSPIALFFVNDANDLMPVAIQLFRNKRPSGPDNPVFFPHDDKYAWMLAKMWFNNADASYHQACSHLGFTHLLIETIYLALRQTMSISHPLYHLMAPHFFYVLSVNNTAFSSLVNEDGWVDRSMSMGVKGMWQIVRRRYQGCAHASSHKQEDLQMDETDAADAEWRMSNQWELNGEGNLENDIKARGVEDLPKYYFRDDGLPVFRTIKEYVSSVVNAHYSDVDTLRTDYEVQDWAAKLSASVDDGGSAIGGVAGNGQFSTVDQLIDTITSVIYISSTSHAAVNFHQYEQYGYPFNYPAILYGEPPRRKDGYGEVDILQCLPTKKNTLGTMSITSLLSNKATKKLGNFEINYQFDKIGKKAVVQFKADLQNLEDDYERRDRTRNVDYDILHPKYIPNAISI